MTSSSVGSVTATSPIGGVSSSVSTSFAAGSSTDVTFATLLDNASAQISPSSIAPSASGGALFIGYEGPTSLLDTGQISAAPPLPMAFASAASASPSAASAPLISQLSTSPTPSPTLATTSPVSTTTNASAVASTAEQYLGTPYLWGGTTPAGFDCSGFVQYVFARLGVQLPRTSEQQANVGQPVASLADARPGDLLFFAGSDGTASSPGHVAIYVGGNQMIDAPYTGTNVRIEPIPNAGYIVAIRRVVG